MKLNMNPEPAIGINCKPSENKSPTPCLPVQKTFPFAYFAWFAVSTPGFRMKTMLILLMGVLTAQAQLSVTVSPVKITGQKAVVPLAMKNMFNENVESARATLTKLV